MKYRDMIIEPFVKWAGGKRQLIPIMKSIKPSIIKNYYEPFLGGGSFLFQLVYEKATISDLNTELINCYKVIREYPLELIDDLRTHVNSPDYFYEIRSLDRSSDFCNLSMVKKASRFIYLNKTCYNGLYRVNKKGQFNTSYGKYKKPTIFNGNNIIDLSHYLNTYNIKIWNVSFEKALEGVDNDSFVYLDPPYDPVSDTANFTNYDKLGFNKQDHENLKSACDLINDKNGKFLLSSSSTDFIRSLYSDYNIKEVSANRSINSNGKKRGPVKDLFITNYK